MSWYVGLLRFFDKDRNFDVANFLSCCWWYVLPSPTILPELTRGILRVTKVRDCGISKYQINFEILRFWYYRDILILSWTVEYQNIKSTLRFWYYHDILILSWIEEYQYMKSTLRFWYYHDILILSWIVELSLIHIWRCRRS